MKHTPLPPHLVERQNKLICSECGHVVAADSKPSISQAFYAHVQQAHRPKTTKKTDPA